MYFTMVNNEVKNQIKITCHKCKHIWTPIRLKEGGMYYTCPNCMTKTRGMTFISMKNGN